MLCHCGKSLMLYCCITNSCVVVTAEKKIARIRGLFHWASRACLLRVLSTTSRVPLLLSSSSLLLLLLLPGGEQEESPLTRSPMVAIVTEAWALAGCGAASKATAELPVQQAPPAAAGKAKKAVSFRGVSSGGGGGHDRREAVVVGRRSGLASCLLAAVAASFSPLAGDRPARALVLEEDDDIELLERVKEDRKKRLQKQGVISSSGTETGYLQDLIYKLSKVGQAIDKDDLPAASSVLGPSSNAQWVQNINAAFSKFSSSPEERSVVDSFNSSLDSLFTSVSKLDAESSKSAFVSSATALEKWIALAGLSGQLKGF